MADIKNENYDIELIFLLSHPSDLNLTLKILDCIDVKSYLILIQCNRFSSKISSILDKKSIKNYQVFDNEIRYGNKNIFKNIYYSYKLKYFFLRFKHTKLIIFDKSQLVSNIALSCFKKYLIISYFSKNKNIYEINIIFSLVTLFYSLLLILRPVLTFKTEKEINTKTQPFPDYKSILFWNGSGPPNKQISFSTTKISKNNEIIIFGSRFSEWKINNRQQIIKEIIGFYEQLFHNFPSSSYIYCPHPRESKNEFKIIKSVFGGSLKLVDNFITSEDLLSNKEANKFCISISSSSSKSAYLMGFRSYIFLYEIGFEKKILHAHESVHADVAIEYFKPPNNENDLENYPVTISNGDLKNLELFLL